MCRYVSEISGCVIAIDVDRESGRKVLLSRGCAAVSHSGRRQVGAERPN